MKKAQATMFVILGLVIVVLAAFLLYSKTNLLMFNPSSEDLNGELGDIKKHIINCLSQEGKEPIERIALQGGFLTTPPGTYRLHGDQTISYLCWNMEDTPQCRNRMLLKSRMEEQISAAVSFALQECINVQGFKKFGGFEISTPKPWQITTTVNPSSVVLDMTYPVILSSAKSEAKVKAEDFTKAFGFPLGDLYDISQEIIEFEAVYGDYDILTGMLAKRGQFIIEKKRPYPDKIYVINEKDDSFIFQFAVQGESLH